MPAPLSSITMPGIPSTRDLTSAVSVGAKEGVSISILPDALTRISVPCTPAAANLNGLSKRSASRMRRPVTIASAPERRAEMVLRSPGSSGGTCTVEGVDATSRSVPSMSRKSATGALAESSCSTPLRADAARFVCDTAASCKLVSVFKCCIGEACPYIDQL